MVNLYGDDFKENPDKYYDGLNTLFDGNIINMFKRMFYPNVNGHDANPSESYADLFKFRYDLYESGIFDSRTTELFTKDHLNKFKQSKYYKKNKRLFDNFSDDNIVTMMNTVAQDNSNNQSYNDVSYARSGLKLIPKPKRHFKS